MPVYPGTALGILIFVGAAGIVIGVWRLAVGDTKTAKFYLSQGVGITSLVIAYALYKRESGKWVYLGVLGVVCLVIFAGLGGCR